MNGANINDSNDRICSNCRYWTVDVSLRGVANGRICNMGQGHTNPSDACPLFLPKNDIRKPIIK